MPTMEEILKKITANDTSIVREGSKELNEALKNVDGLQALCELLQGSADPQLRQTAALFLKKRCGKSRQWSSLPEEARNGIKDALLKSLVAEQEKFVKRTIVDAIGAIIIVEDSRNLTWPEINMFLQQTTTSDNQNDKALGLFTLSILTSIALPESLLQHVGSYTMFFNRTLSTEKDLNSHVTYYIIQCLINFSSVIGEKQEIKAMYAELLPKVIKAIEVMSKKRPDRAHETLDLFFELADRNKTVDLVRQRLRPIVELCLDLVRDQSVKMDLQVKALSLLSQLSQSNMPALISMQLMVPILETVLKLLCEKPDDEENELYFSSDSDEESLLTCATATLDEIALAADADTLMPHIIEFVDRGMKGDDPYIHKACYLALGVVAQGAEDAIRENYCGQLVKLIIRGMVSDRAVIRNAALFALGQFMDFLQPDCNNYTAEIMPLLMALLGELERIGKQGAVGGVADKILFCLQKLVESMDSGAVPLLPEMMPPLLRLSCPPYEPHVRELALITIELAAGAVKEAITPYFNDIMTVINMYIHSPQPAEVANLQIESIDTLGSLVRNVDKEVFERIADETTKIGMTLLQNADEPDLRRSCYSLFGAMSTVLKERIAPILPSLMDPLISSIRDQEGFVQIKEADEVNSDWSEDDDDDEEEDFTVENDFLEEKEVCCQALKDLVENAGESFLPYLETSFIEITKLLDFPGEDVKKSAVETAVSMVVAFTNINTPEGQSAAVQVINNFVGKTTVMVRTEDDKEVVTGVLEGFKALFDKIGNKLDISIKENILLCVKEVAEGKTVCQQDDEDLVVDLDEEEEMLMVAAHEVVPAFGRCVTNNEFNSYFKHFLPLFQERCQKESATAKANVLGTLAECIVPLGPFAFDSLEGFVPFLLCMTKHEDHSVRNNSVYFLGEFVLHVAPAATKLYGVILTAIFRMLPDEKDTQVRDNICGATARIILAGVEHVPIDKVVAVLMENLPLKEDFDEDKWVFRALSLLYRRGESVIVNCIGHIVKCAAVSLNAHSPDEETKEEIVSIIQMTSRDFPNEFREALSQMPPEVVNFLELTCAAGTS